MTISAFLLVLCLLQTCAPSSSTSFHVLERGASLSEKTGDTLISPNGVFSAGFFSVGEYAFGFGIWFTNVLPNRTVVWMANRDQPVGKKSKVSLLKNGNLILKDAGRKVLWSTDTATASHSSVKLQLKDTGNLVLHTSDGENTLWESFHSPTDTLLPKQLFTRDTYLISSRSQNNFSSGNYKLFFDDDNVLHLLYHVPAISSLYWPPAWEWPYEAGRTTYNESRTAVLDPSGYFVSSDGLEFSSTDFGVGPLRRLTLDPDGNLRLYSFEPKTMEWVVSWQAIPQPCIVHGICGPNGVCTYDPGLGRRCSCLPGYKVKDDSDWSRGCEPEFKSSCNQSYFGFLNFTHVEFYGYDTGAFRNVTLQECMDKCMNMCDCKGFQYKFVSDKSRIAEKKLGFACYPKTLLFNGQRSPGFRGDIYLKLPKASPFFNKTTIEALKLNCRSNSSLSINKSYEELRENRTLKFLLWFAIALGLVEIASIFLVWFFLFIANEDTKAIHQGYLVAATKFKRFTYAELKKATKSFSQEIGRGSGGVVYRALLSDKRVAAVKRLNEAKQGEAEFLTEVKTIEKLNHMNLIEMWGYCAEGKNRILVYEYMEHGSLADNLHSNSISWDKRFEIAVGTAKGLAYLHDECLEWVLHCDIKPQNILLDSNYQPKVADFGLSKLQSRGGLDSSFSRIRGTRGYMAPEWVSNIPISSKVDVYSYGIVLLELVTGKSPAAAAFQTLETEGTKERGTLVTWVTEKKNGAASREAWIQEIVDPVISCNYDVNKMEIIVKVALQCVEEDRDTRPSMSQVVEMLLSYEDESPRVKISL